MDQTPTLHDHFHNKRIHAINFWCVNYACRHRDAEAVGKLAIDWGTSTTLPDLAGTTYCLVCGCKVHVSPSWGEGGWNFFENL